MRASLRQAFGARVYDLLGGAHGVMCCSCDAEPYAGMHVLGEDAAVVTQLVDQETKAPVPLVDGAIGERVKTSLRWQAQPQLRASVGDIYQVETAPCSCGAPGPRVRVLGRTDDLLIVKGVKVYPAAVKNLIQELVPLASGSFRIVLDEPGPRVVPPLRLSVERGEDVDDVGRRAPRGRARAADAPAAERPPGDHDRRRRDLRAHGAQGEADRAPLRAGHVTPQAVRVLVACSTRRPSSSSRSRCPSASDSVRNGSLRATSPQISSASSCAVDRPAPRASTIRSLRRWWNAMRSPTSRP